jgi:hypothetical protein
MDIELDSDMKTKVVVLNNHTLGFISPDVPNDVQILHSSILKGSPFGIHQDSAPIRANDTIRLATSFDFNDFRVSEVGWYSDTDCEYIRIVN